MQLQDNICGAGLICRFSGTRALLGGLTGIRALPDKGQYCWVSQPLYANLNNSYRKCL